MGICTEILSNVCIRIHVYQEPGTELRRKGALQTPFCDSGSSCRRKPVGDAYRTYRLEQGTVNYDQVGPGSVSSIVELPIAKIPRMELASFSCKSWGFAASRA
jgi:hypothetical protein